MKDLILYGQIYQYFEQICSKYQCGFRQDYNTQDCLLLMVEKGKEALDKGGFSGALLTNGCIQSFRLH